ncbi:MAG: TolC family protein [Verrucomicrobiota bacterium]
MNSIRLDEVISIGQILGQCVRNGKPFGLSVGGWWHWLLLMVCFRMIWSKPGRPDRNAALAEVPEPRTLFQDEPPGMVKEVAGVRAGRCRAGLVALKNAIGCIELALVAICLAGCAVYQPQPLTHAVVEQHLSGPDWNALQVEAREIRTPLVEPVELNLENGLSPDQAAVLAVLINPFLRAQRDRRGVAAAQVFQAGILPNPQVTGTVDPVIGGTLVPGLTTGYGVSVTWDIQALIQRSARREAASEQSRSVALDVAWSEWQTAQSARVAVYRVAADEAELAAAQAVDRRLAENLSIIQRAVDAHIKTVVDLVSAEFASQNAHVTVLGLQQDIADQYVALKRALGVPSDTTIRLRPGIDLPSRDDAPPLEELQRGLEENRLDLMALKRGYASQEQTVRAAILGRFPKISLGANYASDTSNIRTLGPAAALDLPIFDRNQGRIAIERATRQRLFDEYINRVFEARSDITRALADIQSLTSQIGAAQATVPVLERVVETYRVALNQRQVDAFSYYTAQNNLNQERIQVLKLQQQLVETHVALELASGRYLPLGQSRDNSQRRTSR